MKSIVMDTLP